MEVCFVADNTNETFIDADAGFSNEKNSYETIILNHIQDCVKVLSKEMTGGQVVYKESKTGNEKYIEDVRELVINHIDTLRMLMCTYIKGTNKEQLDKVLGEVQSFLKELQERKILIPGKGEVQLKNLKGIPVESPIWKEFIHYKAMRYREIFEILVASYNEEKALIRSLEEE